MASANAVKEPFLWEEEEFAVHLAMESDGDGSPGFSDDDDDNMLNVRLDFMRIVIQHCVVC